MFSRFFLFILFFCFANSSAFGSERPHFENIIREIECTLVTDNEAIRNLIPDDLDAQTEMVRYAYNSGKIDVLLKLIRFVKPNILVDPKSGLYVIHFLAVAGEAATIYGIDDIYPKVFEIPTNSNYSAYGLAVLVRNFYLLGLNLYETLVSLGLEGLYQTILLAKKLEEMRFVESLICIVQYLEPQAAASGNPLLHSSDFSSVHNQALGPAGNFDEGTPSSSTTANNVQNEAGSEGFVVHIVTNNPNQTAGSGNGNDAPLEDEPFGNNSTEASPDLPEEFYRSLYMHYSAASL